MDIQPKNNLFLFGSLGLDGFKVFVVNNQETIINDLLYNFEKCKSKSNSKLKLCSMKFCVNTWQKMPQKTRSQLTETAQNLFSSNGTICKIEKKSMHEHYNIRK